MEIIDSVVTYIQGIQADAITIGGTIILFAAAVFGIRWLKAQFF